MGYESVTIIGPTASGKTGKAVAVAKALGGEVISGDSRQVYRGMSIGTGKDLCEYGDTPYHLIDIRDAGEKYNLHQFLSDFNKSYSDILLRGKLPVICGGTGMYVENAVNGVRMPEVPVNVCLREKLADKSLTELTDLLSAYKTLHNKTDVDTLPRALRAIEIQEYYRLHPDEAVLTDKDNIRRLNSLLIGLDIPRDDRRTRISNRLRARLDEGMVDEVRGLIERGVHPDDLIYYGLEYKYVTLHVIGKLSFDDMVKQLEIAIHQFAKRQMTWFRGMERRGWKIEWLRYDMDNSEFVSRVSQMLEV